MKIVVDTNVVISGIFFRGQPSVLIEAIGNNELDVFVNDEIIKEYIDTIDDLMEHKQGNLRKELFSMFVSQLNKIDVKSAVSVCRDPDDDKFINCAIDANAAYIVSGDKDLLSLEKYGGIEIITVADFNEKYLIML